MENTNLNYQDILKNQLELRCMKNSNYSLRAFARDLEMAPSRLSEIINKKKGLSVEAAGCLADKLELTGERKEFFVLSAKAHHARSSKQKQEAIDLLESKKSFHMSPKHIELHEFEKSQSWYHLAILELIELDECDHSAEWLAKKLRLNKIVIQNALARLEKIGLLVKVNNRYQASSQYNATTFDISSEAIKKLHEEMLKKAEVSLYSDDVNQREFLNLTLAFSSEKMSEAKEAIRSFQHEFTQKFYSQEMKKDSVYQLSVQLFKLA